MARLENEHQPQPELTAAGWDAITQECERVYPDQPNPRHYAALIKWMLGGKDPLDGISVYDGGSYWHFVTYGLSELYQKESEDPNVSGYGMEFTLKLEKDGDNEEQELMCICGILQEIARLTFTQGELFLPYEYLYTGQTQGVDAQARSNITGFITLPDVDLHPIRTPNGRVEFVEFVGVTNGELLAIKNKQLTVQELYQRLGSDVTRYHRSPVLP